MLSGATKSGFSFQIEESRLDDWELIEDLAEAENPIKVVSIAKRLLGADQYAKLKEHIRGEDGRVAATAMSEESESIFNSSKNLKN